MTFYLFLLLSIPSTVVKGIIAGTTYCLTYFILKFDIPMLLFAIYRHGNQVPFFE